MMGKTPKFSLFGDVMVKIARAAARGAIEGLMDRYSVDDLRWHIAHDTDLLQEALHATDPRDHKDFQLIQRLASKYKRYGPLVREEVTPDWMVGWLRRNYPGHVLVLETPNGSRWFRTNFERLLNYFFPCG